MLVVVVSTTRTMVSDSITDESGVCADMQRGANTIGSRYMILAISFNVAKVLGCKDSTSAVKSQTKKKGVWRTLLGNDQTPYGGGRRPTLPLSQYHRRWRA